MQYLGISQVKVCMAAHSTVFGTEHRYPKMANGEYLFAFHLVKDFRRIDT